jgi:hypothetical protein
LKSSKPGSSCISAILDPCHMIKLVRNTLGEWGVLRNGSGQEIKWEFIKALHNLQTEQGVHAGNKLRTAHIDWTRQKMKVSLATQTLSRSVADAIRFCRLDLALQQFQGSEATEEFIRIFDEIFDWQNSQNPLGRYTKEPMKLKNQHIWLPFMQKAESYIRSLSDCEGKNILSG